MTVEYERNRSCPKGMGGNAARRWQAASAATTTMERVTAMVRDRGSRMLKTIFTDSHFWIPVVVLVAGIALLVYLH